MKVYIAGPMRGLPEFNFPAFFDAEYRLTTLGHDVFNPARYDVEVLGFESTGRTGHEDLGELGFDLRHTLSKDMEFITTEADAVAVLPGWVASKGATAEVATARALGLPILDAETGEELGSLVEQLSHGEVRTTASTGGQKGDKPARFDLIPVEGLWPLAELYGAGARKYEERNWERGYPWHLSFAAMQRHAWQWWNGEDIDAETGAPHLASVAWHAFALLFFAAHFPQFDDRPTKSDGAAAA